MAKVEFTVQEAVLLLHYYLKVKQGILSRKAAVEECSALLRNLGRSNGVEVDEQYRSRPGINDRMNSMASAFAGRTLVIPAAKIFQKAVELYHQKRAQYEALVRLSLREAGQIEEDKSLLAYLQQRFPQVPEQMLKRALQVVEKEARAAGHRGGLETGFRPGEVARLLAKMERNRGLRGEYRFIMGLIKRILSALGLLEPEVPPRKIETRPAEPRQTKAETRPAEPRQTQVETVSVQPDQAEAGTVSVITAEEPPKEDKGQGDGVAHARTVSELPPPDEEDRKILREAFKQWLRENGTALALSNPGLILINLEKAEEYAAQHKYSYPWLLSYDFDRAKATAQKLANADEEFRRISRQTYNRPLTAVQAVLPFLQEEKRRKLKAAKAAKEDFTAWLVANNYETVAIGAMRTLVTNAQNYAKEKDLAPWELFTHAYEDALALTRALLADEECLALPKAEGFSMKAALKQYAAFLEGELGLEEAEPTETEILTEAAEQIGDEYRGEGSEETGHDTYTIEHSQYGEKKPSSAVTATATPSPTGMVDNIDYAAQVYKQVMIKHFPKGYKLNSPLERKRFCGYYEEETGVAPIERPEGIELILRTEGIVYNDRIYMAESMLGKGMKDEIFAYIDKLFDEGRELVYYQALFDEFSDKLLDHNIYDAGMLKAYLAHMAANKFVIGKNYLSKEERVDVDPVDELRSYLREQAQPMQVDDICRILSHISVGTIRGLLSSYGEFVRNSKGEYFHADALDLTEEELDNIAGLIDEYLKKYEFMSGRELMEAIQKRYPSTYEQQNPLFKELGWRNALKYKLGERYSFAGNIISSAGVNLTTNDIFEKFAAAREAFTMDELVRFATDMGVNIYFDALYREAIRVSRNQFINKDKASFHIKETDAILDRICLGKYLPLSAISEFSFLPSAFQPWTEYLLEQYIAFYSGRYYLLHTSYNQNAVVGAMVKKEYDFASYDELISDVLAESDITLNREAALDYLFEKGYIARRSYANMEKMLINARAKRNQKGKK